MALQINLMLSALESAYQYAEQGWSSFPVHTITDGKCSCGRKCTSPGKHPRTRNGFKAAASDKASLACLFSKLPNANVGIATGDTSGLVVLDIDKKNGGYDSLAKLEKEIGPISEHTLTAASGGGGIHIYFRNSVERIKSGANVLGVGVDIRADRGYILAPNSKHISGKSYFWHHELHRPAELPFDLLDLLSKPRQSPRDGDIIPNGRRNESLFRFAGKLRAKGAGQEEIEQKLLEYNLRNCSNPLSIGEVRMISLSICRYQAGSPDQSYKEQWLSLIWSESGPSKVNVRATLAALSRFMDGDGYNCFPSQELITKIAGFSNRKSVRQNLRAAETEGWLKSYPNPARTDLTHGYLGYVACIPNIVSK